MKLLLAITWVTSTALVQGGEPAADTGAEATVSGATAAYDGAAGEIRVDTPRLVEPDVRIDGLLDDSAWNRAALLRGFTQYDPSEGAPASQRTEVLVFAGPEALYFAVRAYDEAPSAIRATLARRDHIQDSDDYIRVILDTFDDQRRAYVFTVNALGVQHDGLWIEGKESRHGGFGDPIDDNPDFLWDSSGRLEDWGYAVEIRIPFKSLRFRRAPLQRWGLQVVRNIRRLGFNESWAPITADRSNKLAQAGKLLDLTDLDPGLFVEVNPEVTASRLGGENDAGDFRHASPEGDLGLNASYGVTPDLRLDATYNPDFSQVEADAGQIAVNERFALFFPEKRPFFLEGTEVFTLPQQLVYTRTIVDPVGGAKLTGKVGGFDLGYLGVVDRAGDEEEPDAVVNLVRVRRDFGESSTLGLIYTDRTGSGDTFNRVAGADARLVFGGRYTAQLMASGSLTGESGGDPVSGGLYTARLSRAGRHLSFDLGLEGTSPQFRARSGFLRRIGDARLNGQVRYNFWGSPGALIERYGPTVELNGYWNHDALWAGQSPKEREIQVRWSTSFRGNFSLWVTGTTRVFDYASGSYAGLFAGDPEDPVGDVRPFRPAQSDFSAMHGLRAFLSIGGWGPVQGRISADWKETPIFERELGVPVEAADAWRGELGLTLRPTRSLAAEVSLNRQTLRRKSDGSRYSAATIPRIRLQYQFSRAWYVRAIGEYGAQEEERLLDPETGETLYLCDEACEALDGSEDYGLYGDVLLGYEPSPGTVFYVGYSRQMRDSQAFRFRDVTAVADGLFVKLSYRFRL